MGSKSDTHRGRLNLHAQRRKTAPAHTRDTTDGPTQVVGVAPMKFDAKLKLGERFVDRGEIARGGMSTIHRVVDQNLLREVAMKVMSPVLGRDDQHLHRFIQEAQVTGQLEHPNIVPIYEIGADDSGTHYFTMKLIRGETFGEYLERLERESPEDAQYRALQTYLKVCDALSFAHSRGVIHRDVKPSNIMVGYYGQVYLMDWGIAHLMRKEGEDLPGKLGVTMDAPGTVIGTYSYMSPEQARGQVEEVTERSDVFSLGGVLYYLLTGERPFDGDSDEEILAKAQACELRPPDEVAARRPPRVLAGIAMKAMAERQEDRHATVAELRAEVEEVLRGRWRFPVVRFPAGTRILEEGEAGHEAFVIRTGRCRVYRTIDGQEQELTVLGPGEVFGETAVFTGDPRNACVEALEDVELWVVSGKAMLQELGLDSWMGAFVSSLGRRFSERSNAVTRLQGELARETLLRDVLALVAREGDRGDDGERGVSWVRVRETVGKTAGLGERDLRAIVDNASCLRLREGDPPTVTMAPL